MRWDEARVSARHKMLILLFSLFAYGSLFSGIAAAVLRAAAAAALRPEATRVITFKDLLKVRSSRVFSRAFYPSHQALAIRAAKNRTRSEAPTYLTSCSAWWRDGGEGVD